jgi:hypothetical protein
MKLPWQIEPLPTGDALKKEAKRLGVALPPHPADKFVAERTGLGTGDIYAIEAEAELQGRVVEARNERHNAVVSFAQTAGIIASLLITLGLALRSEYRASERESGDMMIRFADMQTKGKSAPLILALDLDGNLEQMNVPTRAMDEEIEDFLDTYELMDAASRNDLISYDVAYDEFSYDLEKALRDRKIREFLSGAIAEEPDMYSGVFDLARRWRLKYPPLSPAWTKPTH